MLKVENPFSLYNRRKSDFLDFKGIGMSVEGTERVREYINTLYYWAV